MGQPDLSRCERTAREVAAEWGLVLGPPFQLSNYSYAAPAGTEMVLKIGWPEDDESVHEADALELWAGNGAVQLLRADRPRRALLLERAHPGTDLSGVDAKVAIHIAVDTAVRLWRPAGQPFAWIGDHVPRWLADAQPESLAARRLLHRGRALFARLEVGADTLVHGDLHHHNILAAGSRHLAIDPKPMLGEREFDVAPFLWNPLGSPMGLEETERRLAGFAEAGLDQRRMRHWALIRGAYLRIGDWIGEPAVQILEAIQPPA